ncbi:MAG: hypothetical protein AAF745_17345 [Planctomycetota bacterium]
MNKFKKIRDEVVAEEQRQAERQKHLDAEKEKEAQELSAMRIEARKILDDVIYPQLKECEQEIRDAGFGQVSTFRNGNAVGLSLVVVVTDSGSEEVLEIYFDGRFFVQTTIANLVREAEIAMNEISAEWVEMQCVSFFREAMKNRGEPRF